MTLLGSIAEGGFLSDGISSFPAPFLRTIEEAGGIIPIAATSMAIILGSGFRLVSRGCLSSFAGGVFWAVPFFCLLVERGLGGKCLSEIGRYGT
ncbi:MAG: hypothetical protein EGQ86_09975 [Alistipes sp.]|nr:hypothetical protein [Alistipes sp.]